MSRLKISDLSILLVEPSPTQLKVIMQRLTEEGVVQLEGVDSGNAALSALQQYIPDLIISSMYLPDMTAVELINTLRQSEQYNDVPFMLISSETHRWALEPIRQAGVVAILPKPFDPQDLRRALRATLDLIEPEELELEHYDVSELRVLLVDDSPLSRKHIIKILNNMRISKVTAARNGLEAARIYSEAEGDFDLIITDYNMPEMDGKELVEFIRHERHNTYTPILMVTSESDAARLSHVQQAGVSAICDKPFDSHHIREMLFRLLND